MQVKTLRSRHPVFPHPSKHQRFAHIGGVRRLGEHFSVKGLQVEFLDPWLPRIKTELPSLIEIKLEFVLGPTGRRLTSNSAIDIVVKFPVVKQGGLGPGAGQAGGFILDKPVKDRQVGGHRRIRHHRSEILRALNGILESREAGATPTLRLGGDIPPDHVTFTISGSRNTGLVDSGFNRRHRQCDFRSKIDAVVKHDLGDRRTG